MSKQIKISPKLLWLTSYVEEGIKLIPQDKKITRLGYWRFGTRLGRNAHAAILTNDEKEYRIYIKDMYQRKDMKAPKPFSKIDIVKSLAHELAHVVSWEHTPQHSILEAQLTIVFMIKLKQDGYISEEVELT